MDDATDTTARATWSERLLLWGPGMVVGLGAGVVTAHGLFVVAAAAGVSAGIAWLSPIITDGLALVAYGATHRLHGRGTIYAWTVVVLAAGLSGLAQAIYLDNTLEVSRATRFGVGAWPALAAALSAHLIYLLGRSLPPVAATRSLTVRPSISAVRQPHPQQKHRPTSASADVVPMSRRLILTTSHSARRRAAFASVALR